LRRSFLPAVPTARAYYLHCLDISILLRDFGRKSYIVVFYMRFARDLSPQPSEKALAHPAEKHGEEGFANDVEIRR
jgi:hypothetical protein